MSVFESVLDSVHRNRQRNVRGQISLFDLAGDQESGLMAMPRPRFRAPACFWPWRRR